MSRESAESLSIATVSIPTRPEPPENLTEYQRKVWRDVTSTKPPEWFESDTYPILEAYCKAAENCRNLSRKIETLDVAGEDDPKKIKDWFSMYDTQAKLVGLLAVKMRLTQQSRYTPRSSVTANKKASQGRKPWEN